MKIRFSGIILFAFLLLAGVFFFFAINDTYYINNESFSLGADSSTYYNAAINWDFGITPAFALNYNYLGPLLVLLVAEMNNLKVFCINSALLLIAYFCLVHTFKLNRKKFIILLIINPMLIASLLLVNKEILGLFSIAMFLCFLETKSWKFLIGALVFAFLTRWQEALVIIVFLILVSPVNIFRKNRAFTIILLVSAITLVYPYFLSPILGGVVDDATIERQTQSAFGFATILNSLQDNYLFFVALIPKILANLFGNVFRFFGYILNPNSINFYDLYNSFVVLGHQIAMFLLTIMMFTKRSITLKSDEIYFSLIYLILFSISLMVQYRYIFPLYILFCVVLAKKNNENLVVN
jgi:hypothetical protein